MADGQIFGLAVLVLCSHDCIQLEVLYLRTPPIKSILPSYEPRQLNIITMFSKLFIVLTAVVVAVSTQGTPTSASSRVVPSLDSCTLAWVLLHKIDVLLCTFSW